MRFDEWLAAKTARIAEPGRPISIPVSAEGLRARYDAGETLGMLAADFKCSINAIRRRLVSVGTKMRPPGWRKECP